jgi:chromosome segregation ATPase
MSTETDELESAVAEAEVDLEELTRQAREAHRQWKVLDRQQDAKSYELAVLRRQLREVREARK